MKAPPPEELSEILREVRRIEVQSKRLVTGVLAGEYRSVFRGSGIEFDEVREYVEGDDPRTVDWNVTARVGRPFVKKYVDEREMTVLFLVDCSSSMDSSYGDRSLRATAARTLACLGLSAVRNHDRIGMITFAEEVEAFVPPRKGTAHALRIVRDALVAPTSPGTHGMTAALQFAARAVRRHAVVFLVSDFLSLPDRRALTACSQRHDVIALRLCPPELDPAISGLTRMRDPETGQTVVVDWSSGAVRREWQRRIEQWRSTMAQLLRGARVDLVDLPVESSARTDVSRPLLSFFRMREQREAKE